jgi:methionyl aminopeptidase
MEDLAAWRRAGVVAAQALEYGRTLIKDGATIRDVCDKVDAKVVALGARPAWPTQVALDEVAAHFTPDPGDDAVFDGDLVCLDVGAHVDGCIGDNATTVDLSGRHTHIVKASEEALRNAIRTVAVGVTLGEIGRVIQDTIESHGLKPIRNLSGHGISPWVIHDSPTVPNFGNDDERVLQGDQVIAIEPFATDGMGLIQEAGQANLFAVVADRPVRNPLAREVLATVRSEYRSLPFTTRWLSPRFGPGKSRLALAELKRNGIVHAYPPLVEKGKGMVAVFEKTLYVGDKVEVLTAAG